MIDLGSISMGPSDTEESLGPITLPEQHDTIWLRVTQTSPTKNWRYSYGLASYVSENGAELGTTKIYGNPNGEVFTIGVGLPPRVRTGSIRFICRHYNLAWLKTEGAPTWDLSFQWESGLSGAGPGAFGTRATLGVPSDLDSSGVSYAITDGTAKIRLSPR